MKRPSGGDGGGDVHPGQAGCVSAIGRRLVATGIAAVLAIKSYGVFLMRTRRPR